MRHAERGLTLVEAVIAAGLSTIAIGAFLLQFRIMQNSFNVATDEARLPQAGAQILARIAAGEGNLSLAFAPTSESKVGAGGDYRFGFRLESTRLRFQLPPNPSFPQAHFEDLWAEPSRRGRHTLWLSDQASTAIGDVQISGSAAISMINFYSPEMVESSTVPGIDFTILGASATASTTFNGNPAQYFYEGAGATAPLASIQYSRTGAGWRFQWPTGNPTQVVVPFIPNAIFVLDGETNGMQHGYLTCQWPAVENPNPAGSGTLTRKSLAYVRRVGVYLRMGTNPYGAPIQFRHTFRLRN